MPLYLDINLTSLHVPGYYSQDGRRHSFNQVNPGAGITLDTANWSFKVGEYLNSYHKPTWYVAAGPQAHFRMGVFKGSLGGLLGVATGYNHTVEPVRQIAPLGLIDLCLGYKQLRLFMGWIPPYPVSVFTFQLEWRIK